MRWVGCTLWTNIPEDKESEELSKISNDFRNIYVWEGRGEEGGEGGGEGGEGKREKRLFEAKDWRKFHQEDVKFLKKEIEQAKTDNLPLIILTHHAPTFTHTTKKLDKKLGISILNATNLEKLFGNPVKIWGYGHTHRTSDQVLGGTRVVSNQFGYCLGRGEGGEGGESVDKYFSEDFVVEVDFDEEEIEGRRRGWWGEGSEEEEVECYNS